jgi:hypothetical protein
MILIIKNSIDLSGGWFDFSVGDVSIKLKIRPLIADLGKVIESRHKKISSLKMHGHKIIKKMETNYQTFSPDLIDYVLEDFSGIGSAPERHFEITLENKLKILSIKNVTSFIFRKSFELAEERIKEVVKFEMEEI